MAFQHSLLNGWALLTGRLHGFPFTFTHRLGGKWSSWGQLVSDRQNRNWTWTEKSHLVPEMSLWEQKHIYQCAAAQTLYISELFMNNSASCVDGAALNFTLSCWSAELAAALKRRRNMSPETAGCCLTLQRDREKAGKDMFNSWGHYI